MLLGVVGGVEFDAGVELLLDWVLEAVVAAEDDDELELSDELELLSSDELEDLSELDELDELEDSFFLSSSQVQFAVTANVFNINITRLSPVRAFFVLHHISHHLLVELTSKS